MVARDPVRTVDRKAHAASHDESVDQRHVWLAIMLDRGIEAVFRTPIADRLVDPAGCAVFVERAQVASRRERALSCGSENDPRHRGVIRPFTKLVAESRN